MKCYSLKTVFIFGAIWLFSISCAHKETPLQEQLMHNEQKIDEIISSMTLEEKVEMLHSKTIMSSEGIPRLNIQEIRYADGPFGVREEVGNGFRPLGWETDSATYFPTGSALAATWSKELAYAYGAGIGEEARTRGKDIMLGPAINIQRLPVGGRTYEYFSEDPLLNGILAVNYVKGMQDVGTAACIKHYALNNQETNRGSVNVIVDERTLREIYLKPFEMAIVDGGAMCVMPAYNKVNGYYGSENAYLNNTILRDEWGFKGMTVSDWGGTHSTMGAALGGLNVQMTGSNYLGQPLIDSINAGVLSEQIVDDKVREILRLRFAIDPIPENLANLKNPSTPAHLKTAYEVASKSIVLLKNDNNTLPLNLNEISKIAVIGLNATATTAAGGMGAGVKTVYEVTPLQGLLNRVGDKAEIIYAQGYKNYMGMFGRIMSSPNIASTIDEQPDSKLLNEALEAAKGADVVLFFAGTNKSIETEGSDRKDIMLPVGQDMLITEIAKVNNNIITIVVSGGPCDLNIVDGYSDAIVEAWWNGSEGGNALADVLLGNISPSGKLPFTFPKRLEDSPAFALKNFPQQSNSAGDVFASQFRQDVVGENAPSWRARNNSPTAEYSEGLYVGYRWFDKQKTEVMYPFGHGLSYAEFEYSNLRTDRNTYKEKNEIKITITLNNISSISADEVVQVYVSRPNSNIEWPVKELKAFERVSVTSGQSKDVTLTIPVEELRYWDIQTNDWNLEKGEIELLVGTSSSDIKLTKLINIK